MVKVSKKDWEEFQKWKLEKEKPKEEVEELEIEPDVDLSEFAEEEEVPEEEYICPKCNYTSDKPFNVCPKCGAKLKWD